MVLLGGGGAMVLGAVALWRLRQRQSEFVGSGWAITGLCTGPIPFGVASIVGIAVGLPMLSSVNVEIDEVAESSYDQSESAAESDSGFRSYRRTTKLVDAAIEKAFKVLIGEFNHLCRAKRFDEAMVIAKLARLLRPDDELAEYMVVKARRGGNERLKKRRIDEFGQCLISYESDSTEE
ncbi:MAG: hypothetical protein NT069_21955, partial [Planctomycetota bacterium]|nr:hypothetical protein [Planctomycetota bacterium]